ncbi:hypothetical protein [Cytobacillus praedii]|uniref:hypothetical protein n=1 Tax=Cytobacillus praedii TaxID=1742358 RepID=UPI002E22886C|nr:hypothetical protein [Cytobacillus praedii]
MIKLFSKILVTGTLFLSFIVLAFTSIEPDKVEAASKILPDNHSIEQLKVEWRKDLNHGYLIDVGDRIGTLLIRVDQPKIERNIEWVNWSISKPMSVSFQLSKDISLNNHLNTSNRISYFGGLYSIDLFGYQKGTGYMKFSDFGNPNYYAGLAIFLNKKYNNNGVYWFGGNGYALREPGQVKAYFFHGVDVVQESMEGVKTGGTFPLINKVMWGKTELIKGQLGKITVKQPIVLWKRLNNGELEKERDLKAGEEFRVYRYLEDQGGLYGVGSGMFVQKDTTKVLYETPSKKNLRLVKIMNGE